MLQRPDTASLVCSLTPRNIYSDGLEIPEPEDKDEPNNRYSWPAHPELRNILKCKIQALSISDEEVEARPSAILSGLNEDAVIAPLLPSLPRLRKDISLHRRRRLPP